MQVASPELSTFRIRPYFGLPRRVMAVAATPAERLGKIGIPVFWPLAVYW